MKEQIEIKAVTVKKLASATFGGALESVNVATTTAGTKANAAETSLATIVTSGQIHDLTVDNNYDLKTLTLGHKEDAFAATAPSIIITDNIQLTGFTTSVTMIRNLDIQRNYQLESPNFSSIVSLPANYGTTSVTDITILDNYTDGSERKSKLGATADATTSGLYADVYGLKGTYQPETGATALSFGQSAIATLNGLFKALDAKFDPVSGTAVKSDIDIHIEYRYDSTTGGTASVGDIIFDGAFSGSTWTDDFTATSTVSSADEELFLDQLLLIK